MEAEVENWVGRSRGAGESAGESAGELERALEKRARTGGGRLVGTGHGARDGGGGGGGGGGGWWGTRGREAHGGKKEGEGGTTMGGDVKETGRGVGVRSKRDI